MYMNTAASATTTIPMIMPITMAGIWDWLLIAEVSLVAVTIGAGVVGTWVAEITNVR